MLRSNREEDRFVQWCKLIVFYRQTKEVAAFQCLDFIVIRFVELKRIASRDCFGRKNSQLKSGRFFVELARTTRLHEFSTHHYADAIAERKGFFLIVRDVNGGQAETCHELAQLAASFFTNAG